jgi:uncharacterized protein (DUF2147 family)
MNRQCLITLLIVSACVSSFAQTSIFGRWKSIDDQTGEAKSVVEIYEKNGKVYGRIVSLIQTPDDDPDPVCSKCPAEDPRHNKKVIGMEIIRDLQKNGQVYSEGNILDPEVGKVYRCKIWLESNELKVRGYWGPVWRTQSWKRA